jgi:hypothetical protein
MPRPRLDRNLRHSAGVVVGSLSLAATCASAQDGAGDAITQANNPLLNLQFR